MFYNSVLFNDANPTMIDIDMEKLSVSRRLLNIYGRSL